MIIHTMIDKSSKGTLADHIHARTTASKTDPNRTYKNIQKIMF